MWRKFEALIHVNPTLDTLNQFLEWLKAPIQLEKPGGFDGAGALDANSAIRLNPDGSLILELFVQWQNIPTPGQIDIVENGIRVRLDSTAQIKDCGAVPEPTAQAGAPADAGQALNDDQNKATGSIPPYSA